METARLTGPSTPSSAGDFQSPGGKSVVSTPSMTSPGSVGGGSAGETSLTPWMEKLTMGRGRGRPRKELKYTVDYSDFPKDGTESEQERYCSKKRTELWRLKTLTGPDSAEHRQKERIRVNKYHQKKREEKKVAAAGVPEVEDDDDEVEEKSKGQSRVR